MSSDTPSPAASGNGSGAPGEVSGQGAGEEARPPLVINAQYVKDLSFEVPGAPGIFGQMQQGAPEIAIKVDVQARNLEERFSRSSSTSVPTASRATPSPSSSSCPMVACSP